MRSRSVILATLLAIVAGAGPTSSASATSTDSLARAAAISAEVDARYAGLRVTEASSTAVIDSVTLFTEADPRVVPAANGIYFAVCPIRATCPYPGHGARPRSAFAPRRLALELAVRAFLETEADLVLVSLPTRQFVLLVFERGELDERSISESIAGDPRGQASLQVRSVVDNATLSRLFAPFGLERCANGRDTLLAIGLRPGRAPAISGAPRRGLATTRNRTILAARTWKRPRPSDKAAGTVETATAPNDFQVFNDYATPERTFSAQRAVVHYVVRGIDAPALNDDDGNGVPDYVERAGEAADTAIAYYERRRFHSILPDSGGPDSRPDLYVSRFAPGWFGVAFPAASAEGGAFVAIANNLDPSREASLGSVYGTVAHELFHLMQFSYFSYAHPAMPRWVSEGSAAAMEARVYPDLADIVSSLQLRNWFAAPERSITKQAYGSQLLWRFLDVLDARLLPAYLSRLAAQPFSGEGERALVGTFRSVTHAGFAAPFHRFALEVADEHGDELTPVRTLRFTGAYRSSVAPLAIHYIKVSLADRGRHAVTVSFWSGPTGADASLIYQAESSTPGYPSTLVRVEADRSDRGRKLTFTIPARLQRSTRFAAPMLVVSNGSPTRVAHYSVSTR